ncbi:virulence plasmid 65kDa B protein-domain-containing protein [Cladorrhinum sp. PSN259]|nr:virulence plasmid 65kDa B protein-domain-containing protein [Cladorrhinum sp. PSN259]
MDASSESRTRPAWARGRVPASGTATGSGAQPTGGFGEEQDNQSPLPTASLPKGGGAIRGMGEKFETNPVKGTATMCIPVATSAGRDGFQPRLALSYDSASGNGPFGFGWSLAMDSVTRRTSKGLPRYRDDQESDVFLLSGGEDLVPVMLPGATRHEDTVSVPGYTIHRYRSRIETSFKRVERWTNSAVDGDVHWRVLTSDDALHIYGRNANSRISDPRAPHRIFSWLLSDSRDWKGNAIVFVYKEENGQGVDLAQPHQRNRGIAGDTRRTANRYVKSVKYGNTVPFIDADGERLLFPSDDFLATAGWMFELVFDYGEHTAVPLTPREDSEWTHRPDAFSTFRPGFEVRTSRLCRRALMFHHFPDELGVGRDCLVSSTTLIYRTPEAGGTGNRIYTFLDTVEQSGYRRDATEPSGYLQRSNPRVQFAYSEPVIDDRLRAVDPSALENAPAGLASTNAQWIDLYGEGIAGLLTRSDGAWYYKRNISPLSEPPSPDWSDGTPTPELMFDVLETVPTNPNLGPGDPVHFADLKGDGSISLVTDRGAMGYYAEDGVESWLPFQPFRSAMKTGLSDPRVQLLDLTGDGIPDAFFPSKGLWYPSLGTEGYGPPEPFSYELGVDECGSPVDIFRNDTLGATRLADFTGDGMMDIVRIANGSVCVWPNLGYGRFGAPVTMDNSPVFDSDECFDPRRLILCDIDGSGTTDLIYLHQRGARVYFNESGNGWSGATLLASTRDTSFSRDVVATTADIHGNGTSCLVLSTSLPGEPHAMQYVDLMGSTKPHLLVGTDNNLGAETRIRYTSSTKFYLQDRRAGRPWLHTLAIPVHVVESVTSIDHISRCRFTSRYAYHHGYYDGAEREFRGFGAVDRWDVEELSAVVGQAAAEQPANLDPTYLLSPIRTSSWFHLGLAVGGTEMSTAYRKEFFQDPSAHVLPQTVLPVGMAASEEHDACRALRGSLLRSEVYLEDAPPGSSPEAAARAAVPVSAAEMNYTLTRVQAAGGASGHSVFFVSPREVLNYHYERSVGDPRISHQMVLQSNEWGQTLREVAIRYGRRVPDATLPTKWDRDQQTAIHVTYTENKTTNAIDGDAQHPHSYRLPVNCEMRGYELTGVDPAGTASTAFTFEQFSDTNFALLDSAEEIPYDASPTLAAPQKRILGVKRILYRSDNLSVFLPLQQLGVTGLAGQTYSLAFTKAMFDAAYQKDGMPLLAIPDGILTSTSGDGGGYISTAMLRASGLMPQEDKYDGYWTLSARTFFSLSPDPVVEVGEARAHFFRVRQTQDVFGVTSSVTFDSYDLLVSETRDHAGNVVTAGERDDVSGAVIKPGNDYRVLKCHTLTDINGNRAAVVFDALGAVVGGALMGKLSDERAGKRVGDDLTGFVADLPEQTMLDHLRDPIANARDILKGSATRSIYDLFAFARTRNSDNPQPAVTYTMSRNTHEADLTPGQEPEIYHAFHYSDGLGRLIQSKQQTKPGPVASRGPDGRIIVDPDGQPVPTEQPVDPRWVSSGWVIYNNKQLRVAEFEPFFTDLHTFEFDTRAGVSPVYFYDAASRPVAVLSPNNSYVKSLFSAWHAEEWDNHDTVELDPRTDPDVQHYVESHFAQRPGFQTWLQERLPKPPTDLDRQAAEKTRPHAGTPVLSYLDSLGRKFLSAGWNKIALKDHDLNGQEWKQYSRVEADIQGNGLVIRDTFTESGDPRGRIVETFRYNMVGSAMIRSSMDSGTRLWLNTSQGRPLYSWDNRGHCIRTRYDTAGRFLFSSVLSDQGAPDGPDSELTFAYAVYGDHHPRAAELNLRGGVYLSADQAGVKVNERRDFKGNLVSSSQIYALEYKKTVDWSVLASILAPDMAPAATFTEAALAAALDTRLQAETFRDGVAFDAKNRPLTMSSPNSDGHITASRFTYNVASLVTIESNLRGEVDASGQPVWTPFVVDIDYDARGVRSYISYGNGVTTNYAYSNLGELTGIRSTRTKSGSSGTREVLQDISYTYDLSQLQTHILDAAQQTVYFNNEVVDASNGYTYDALYQLIRATGREHLGQPGGSPVPYGSDDAVRSGPQPGDGRAMSRYTEDYVYNRAGGMTKMRHWIGNAIDPGHSWTRSFTYSEPSLLEPAKSCNRLTSTSVGPLTESFAYDAHGNTIRMPHLNGGAGGPNTPNMSSDFLDQTRRLDLGGGGTAYYVYDAEGTRVRKVVERDGFLTQERLYLGGTIELYRVRRQGRLRLERETFHVHQGDERVAMVETRTLDVDGTDPAPPQVQRFQLCSHLRSATIEVDAQGRVLTYEEYAPYGSTTYQAKDAALELPKRYRFAGKERDDESGLEYHGARYYAPWLARWTSPDPGGTGADTLNGVEGGPKPTMRELAELPEAQQPGWFQNWMKGRDAEKHVAKLERLAARGKAGAVVETEVWIKRLPGKIFRGVKRLDIITREKAIQVKWVGIKVTEKVGEIGGDLIDTPGIRNAIKSGFADAATEVEAIAEHAKTGQKILQNTLKEGEEAWQSVRAVSTWGKGKGPGEFVLKFVVDGEAKVVNQFRNIAQEVATAEGFKHTVDVVKGTGRSAGSIAAKMFGTGLGVLGIGAGIYGLATAKTTGEKLLAGADIVAGVLTVIPATAPIGAALGLALGAGRLAAWAWDKWGKSEPEQGPPAEKPPEQLTPADPGPDLVSQAPKPEPEPEKPKEEPPPPPEAPVDKPRAHPKPPPQKYTPTIIETPRSPPGSMRGIDCA